VLLMSYSMGKHQEEDEFEEDQMPIPPLSPSQDRSDDYALRNRIFLENEHRWYFGTVAVPSLVSPASRGPISLNPEMAEFSALRWSPIMHEWYPPAVRRVIVVTLMLLKRLAPNYDRQLRYKIIRFVADGVDENAHIIEKRMHANCSIQLLD
jgi:hypothetical protein